LDEWVGAIVEVNHRTEILPDDKPEYVVVDSTIKRRDGDRIEEINVSSALIAPTTGGSLLNALQTMDDAWDYKLPNEGESDFEIDLGPYRFLGWLRSPDRDGYMDDKDPLRGNASIINVFPGRRVSEACRLTRDKDYHACWYSDSSQEPMFIFEVWGERDKDGDQYTECSICTGHRLLAQKQQLQKFLNNQKFDLITEVEVTRRGRENERYYHAEKKKVPEERFDRLYLLRSGGTLEITEGCIGAWTSDCTRA
jgi:hypothetical protein